MHLVARGPAAAQIGGVRFLNGRCVQRGGAGIEPGCADAWFEPAFPFAR